MFPEPQEQGKELQGGKNQWRKKVEGKKVKGRCKCHLAVNAKQINLSMCSAAPCV